MSGGGHSAAGGGGVSGGHSAAVGACAWPSMVANRASLYSGVFSDGNLTYIVEPKEIAGPWGPPQVNKASRAFLPSF